MMYGDKKKRHMARSILPSKARKTASEERAWIHRRARRRESMICHEALRSPDLRDFDDQGFSLDIKNLVRERQAADKLNHFEKWAIQVTRHYAEDARGRVAHIQKILPKGLIGWHAFTHLEQNSEFKTHRFSLWVRPPRRAWLTITERSLDREEAIRILHEVVRLPARMGQLAEHLQNRHRRVIWKLGYREVTEGSLKNGVPYNRTRMVPVQLPVGPKSPPVMTSKTVVNFVDLLFAARKVRWVEPPKQYSSLKFRASRVGDPDCHPEWWRALTEFCIAFKRGKLDDSWGEGNLYARRLWWDVWG